jgi:creatinine amidohydrolase
LRVSIEQHGPHLPVMTDTRLGHEIAVRAARLAYPTRPTVVAPVVWSGLSEHHMAFGGTLTLSQPVFLEVLRDLVTSLVRLGFTNILISNSHGGNIVAMKQLADAMAPDSEAVIVATTYASEAGAAFNDLLEDQDSIQHACEAETAMMMAVEPDLVDKSDLAGLGAENDMSRDFLQAGRASYRWRPFQHMTGNGIAGNPARATAEKGEKLLDVAARAVADLIVDPATWAAPDDMRGGGTMGEPFRR